MTARPRHGDGLAEVVRSSWGVRINATVDLGGTTDLNVLGRGPGGELVVVRVPRAEIDADRPAVLVGARRACHAAGVRRTPRS